VQKDELVVVSVSVIVGVVLVVASGVVVVVGVSVDVVGLIVMVVMDVSVVEDNGQERSGKSSCLFTLSDRAPQLLRASPGCLFPTKILVSAFKVAISLEKPTSNYY
jgi:hypothetical protein